MQWDAVLFDFEDTLVDLTRGGSRKGPLYFNGAPGAPPVRDARGRPVMEAMLRLMEAGVPVAVVTSSPEAAMGRWFQEQQLCLSRPMTVVGFHDTVLHRPSPHPLIEALHQLGLPASRRILSVGDSAADIEAARRAGLTSATVRPLTPLGMPADLFLPTVESFFDEKLSFALAGDLESDLRKISLTGASGDFEFRVGGRIKHRPTNRLTQLIDWTREGRWDEALVDLAETLVAHSLGAQREDVLLTAVPPHRGQPDRLGALMARLRSRTGFTATPLLRFGNDPGRQATRERRSRVDAMEGCLHSRGKHDLSGQTVVVFDDVRSSGATLREAARALLADGAARVLGLALAQEENRLAELASFGPLPSLAPETLVLTVAEGETDTAPAAVTIGDEASLDETSQDAETRRRILGRARVLGPGVRAEDGDDDSRDDALGLAVPGPMRPSPLPLGFARPAGVLGVATRGDDESSSDIQERVSDADLPISRDLSDVADMASLPDSSAQRAPVAAPGVQELVRPPEPTTPAEVKARYPRAYQRWLADEDAHLGELYRSGVHEIFALADALGRQPAAVDSRIRRLGLDLDPFLEGEEEEFDGAERVEVEQLEVVAAPMTVDAPSAVNEPSDVVEATASTVPGPGPVADARTPAEPSPPTIVRAPEPTTPAAIKARYPRAYQRWIAEEDARLRELHAQGLDVPALADALGRQLAAVDSRIRRLGLGMPGGTSAPTGEPQASPITLGDDLAKAATAHEVGAQGANGQALLFAAARRAQAPAASEDDTTEIAAPIEVAPLASTPAEIKARYPRAYQRWLPAEDARLRELHARGLDLDALCDDLLRQPSAVDSRIRRLGLDLDPDDDPEEDGAVEVANPTAPSEVHDAREASAPEPASTLVSSDAPAGDAALTSGLVEAVTDEERRAPEPTTAEGIKARYARAFQRWLPEEDEHLTALHAQGVRLPRLADLLHRQPAAVESRIRRLELDLVPDEDDVDLTASEG